MPQGPQSLNKRFKMYVTGRHFYSWVTSAIRRGKTRDPAANVLGVVKAHRVRLIIRHHMCFLLTPPEWCHLVNIMWPPEQRTWLKTPLGDRGYICCRGVAAGHSGVGPLWENERDTSLCWPQKRKGETFWRQECVCVCLCVCVCVCAAHDEHKKDDSGETRVQIWDTTSTVLQTHIFSLTLHWKLSKGLHFHLFTDPTLYCATTFHIFLAINSQSPCSPCTSVVPLGSMLGSIIYSSCVLVSGPNMSQVCNC